AARQRVPGDVGPGESRDRGAAGARAIPRSARARARRVPHAPHDAPEAGGHALRRSAPDARRGARTDVRPPRTDPGRAVGRSRPCRPRGGLRPRAGHQPGRGVDPDGRAESATMSRDGGLRLRAGSGTEPPGGPGPDAPPGSRGRPSLPGRAERPRGGKRMTPAETLDRADVLVIGGGVLGCSALYQLARRGVDVALVERGELNREASGSNAGTLHVQMPGKHFRLNYDRPDVSAAERDHVCATDRLYAEAARMWRSLETD